MGPWTLAAGARPYQLRAGLGAPGGNLRLFGSLSFATAPLTEPKWFLRTLEIASRERLPQWEWEIKPPAGFRNHSPSPQKPVGVKRVCLFLSNVIATRAHAKLPRIHTLSKENLSSRTSSKQNLVGREVLLTIGLSALVFPTWCAFLVLTNQPRRVIKSDPLRRLSSGDKCL